VNSLAAQISSPIKAVFHAEKLTLCDTFIDIISAKSEVSLKEFEMMFLE